MSSREIRLIRLKVKRAEEHLAYFKEITSGRVGPIKTPDTSGLYYDDQRKTTQFHTDATAPPPEWSIVVGEIIHQLRTCLDHLIFALASRGGRLIENPRQLSFPLCKDETDFKADYRVSQGIFLNLIGPDELAEVELSQLYKRRAAPYIIRDYLYVLAKLDDIDKHRAILVLGNQLAVRHDIPGGYTYSREEMKPGTERFRLDWGPAVKPEEVKTEHISMRISIKEPGVQSSESSATIVIAEMIKLVNGVLDRFDRFF